MGYWAYVLQLNSRACDAQSVKCCLSHRSPAALLLDARKNSKAPQSAVVIPCWGWMAVVQSPAGQWRHLAWLMCPVLPQQMHTHTHSQGLYKSHSSLTAKDAGFLLPWTRKGAPSPPSFSLKIHKHTVTCNPWTQVHTNTHTAPPGSMHRGGWFNRDERYYEARGLHTSITRPSPISFSVCATRLTQGSQSRYATFPPNHSTRGNIIQHTKSAEQKRTRHPRHSSSISVAPAFWA